MAAHYTQEFREDAIRLVLEKKSSMTQIARNLGVNDWTLRGWVKDYREKARAAEPRRPETLEEENQRLRRENERLKQERDILKKAAAYFAKEQF